MLDDATWGALALVLTTGGGAWTWWAFRNRGLAAGTRAAGFTLLVPAAAQTGTLELAGEVVTSVADWGAGLVFSPLVWIGLILFGISALLFGASGWMAARGKGGGMPKAAKEPKADKALPPAKQQKGAPAIDDEMAEIEAILKKRGIS